MTTELAKGFLYCSDCDSAYVELVEFPVMEPANATSGERSIFVSYRCFNCKLINSLRITDDKKGSVTIT